MQPWYHLPSNGAADAETGVGFAETLRDSVECLCLEHIGLADESVVTISVGVATLIPEANQTPLRLVAQADKALYRAKAEGRNRAHLFGN